MTEVAAEQAFKAVINDTAPSSGGRAFGIDITGSNYNHFLGKRIGDTVDGMFVGEGDKSLSGYKLQITGGSDLTGRPMRPELAGGGIKSVLITAGIGYNGIRRRRNLRGNVVSQDTRQINLKITEVGNRSLDAIFGLVDEAVPVEEPSGEEE